MALDYKQSDGTAKIWHRSPQAFIRNPLGGTPSIEYLEEEAIQVGVGGATVTRPLTSLLVESLINPSESFELYHPTSLEPMGKMATYGEVQTLLFSLYLHLAKARDQREALA